jgi:hypothetical protein
MVSNDSGHFILEPNSSLKPFFTRILFLRMTDKRSSVVDGHVAIQPREPTAKMLTVSVDQVEQLFGIGFLNQA